MTTEEGLETYESGKGLEVDAGLYPGSVADVQAVDGQFGPQWRFEFSLDEYPDERPWAWASAKLGTKTKLYGWVGVLLGRALEIGERVIPSDLLGKRCQILIVERSDADGQSRRVVDNILKIKATAPPVAADPDSPPEEQPAPLGQVNLVSNRLNLVPQDIALALCEKYEVEVAYDPDGDKLYITDAGKLTGGAKGSAEKMVAELNAAKKAAKQPA